MRHKVLLVGTLSNRAINYVTGQSVIFDGVVDFFSHKYDVVTINVMDKGKYVRGSVAFLFSRVLQFLSIYIKIIWALITTKVEVVYYQSALSGFGIKRDSIAIKIFSLFHVPVVAHQLGNVDLSLVLIGQKALDEKLKRIVKSLRLILVEGEYMAKEYDKIDTPPNKVIIIPNGYKEENKKEKVAKSYSQQNPFKVFYLSNFIFTKGYFDVLKAMDILANKKMLNVDCCFAGRFYKSLDSNNNDEKNGTKEAFDDFVIEHHLENRVECLPGLFGEEKSDYFQKANVFVLPSYYVGEGQPMSILEAMSYGCVPIVTRHGHIPMMVTDNNGCFVEAKNPDSIADAIEHLIQNPDEYTLKSQQCIADFKEKFTYEKFMQSIEKCLNDAKR